MEEFASWDGGSVDDHHDEVGTVEVQILLSWFFGTAEPNEVPLGVHGPQGVRMPDARAA